jgi:hypothetical protein
MTLGELIARLEAANPNQVVHHGFTNPHSYRGDYMDLAFEPAANITVADMLAAARSALGTTFQGWKGGDFTMTDHTWCWLSQEGDASGETISALLLDFMLAPPAPAAVQPPVDRAGGEPEPTHLRWGLNDVMWGDDDTVTVLLSGPAGEPYWLELDPERAAVLRQDLTGPEGETVDRAADVFTAADLVAALRGAGAERDAVDRAAVNRVRELHRNWDADPGHCAHCQDGMGNPLPWPCPTVQALDGGLRRMADEAQQPETQPAGWHLTPETLDLFVRALVNEVDYDIHKGYECGEEDGEDHYPEMVAEAAEMLNAITAEQPGVVSEPGEEA